MRLRFYETGSPASVLRLESWSPPPPEGHEVLIRVHYSPINPADLNFIEGSYGKLAHLPTTPGNEAYGQVEAVGSDVTSLAPGDWVITLHPIGTWSQYLISSEHQFARLPEGLDPIQASMLRVNPATAWRMLKDFGNLTEGDYIAQNAANSALGQALIQIAKAQGIRTLNFVRRPELTDELLALGADAVLLDDDDGIAQAREIVGTHPPRVAYNAVGGDSALRLMELLAPSGELVTYGAMSRRSLKVPNKYLIFKDLQLRGYWLSKWLEHASHGDIHETLAPLVRMVQQGELKMPVAQVYPLADYQAAMVHAQQSGRTGKIILQFT